MVVEHEPDRADERLVDAPPSTIPPSTPIPPAFYSDDEPPEPDDDDPHWREFPYFESMRGYHLLIAGIIFCVLFATFIHLLVIFTV